MTIFFKKLLSVFLILNHLWIFNILSAAESVFLRTCHQSHTTEGMLWMHPLKMDGECYNVSFDDSLKGLVDPLYFYDSTTLKLLGSLKRIGDSFLNEWTTNQVNIYRTHADFQITGVHKIRIGHDLHGDVDIAAENIELLDDIAVKHHLKFSAQNLLVEKTVKAKGIIFSAKKTGILKSAIESQTSILLDGIFQNEGRLTSVEELVVRGDSFKNNGTLTCQTKYVNSSKDVLENGVVCANEGVFIEAQSIVFSGRIERSPRTYLKAKDRVITKTTSLGDHVVIESKLKHLEPFDGATPDDDYALKAKSLFLKGDEISLVDVGLNVGHLTIHDKDVQFMDFVCPYEKGNLPIIDIVCDHVYGDVGNFYAKSLNVTAETILLFYCGKLCIQSGLIKAKEFDLNAFASALRKPSELGIVTLDVGDKSFFGWLVVENLTTKGKTLFLDGRIQGNRLSAEERESITSDASVVLEHLRARTNDFLHMGSSYVGNLNVCSSGNLSLSNMRASTASLTLDGDEAQLLNCTIGDLWACVLNGTTTLDYVTLLKAKMQTQKFTSIHSLNVGILDLKSTEYVAILDLHVREKASVESEGNTVVCKASGKPLNVSSKGVAIVQANNLEQADINAQHALTYGTATHVTNTGQTASFVGEAESLSNNAVSSSVRATGSGIDHLTQSGTVSTTTGTTVRHFDSNAKHAFISNMDIDTLHPKAGTSVHTFGDVHLKEIEQTEGESFTLSNENQLTLNRGALDLQNLLNFGLIKFLAPSSVAVDGVMVNKEIQGTGHLEVTAQSEIGLGDIEVQRFTQFIHETPLKGQSFSYTPFDEFGPKETVTYSEEELSDFNNQSGFYALDMDASYAQGLLLSRLQNETVKAILAGELFRSLMDDKRVLPDVFYEKTQSLFDELETVDELDPKHEELLKSIKGWCLDESVLTAYSQLVVGSDDYALKVDQDNNPIYGTMDVLAALQGYALEVYVPYFGSLKKVHTFIPTEHGFDGDFNVRRLLLKPSDDSDDHFNILLSEEEWGKRPGFFTDNDSLKGTLKLNLNKNYFADNILSNPNLKPEHFMHYVLKGNQAIKQNHHFDVRTVIETDSHLDLSARLTASTNLTLEAGTMGASDFAVLSNGRATVTTTKGDMTLANGFVVGQTGTVEKVSGSQHVSNVTTGTTHSDTVINVEGNRTAIATAKTHHQDPGNFYQTADQSKTQGRNLALTIGGHHVRQAEITQSTEGTTFLVNGNVMEIPLMLQREVKKDIYKGERTDTYYEPTVTTDTSGGDILSKAGGKHTSEGSVKQARTITIMGERGVEERAAKSIHTYFQRQLFKSGSAFWKKRKEVTQQGMEETAVKEVLNAQLWSRIESQSGDVLFQGVHFASSITHAVAQNGRVLFDQVKNKSTDQIFRTFSNWCWQSMKNQLSEKVTYTDNSAVGKIEVTAKDVDITLVKNKTSCILESIIIKKGTLHQQFVEEVFKHDEVSKGGPSGLLSAIVVIVLSCITGGAGAALGAFLTGGATTVIGGFIAGMAHGAFMALCSTAALALLNSNGNIGNAVRSIGSSSAMRGIIIAAVTMGVGNAFANAYNIPTLMSERSFTQNLQLNSVRSAAYITTRTAFYGRDALKDLHKEALNVAIQAVCADLCKEVGTLRADGLDYMSHKLLHAGIGALSNITGGENAMASGAAGGALGEVFGEFFADSKAVCNQMMTQHPDEPHLWHSLAEDSLKWREFLSKIGPAFMVGLFGGQTQTAYDAADRAIQNNLMPTLFAALYGLSVGKSLYDGYQSNGFEGLLKAAGIEVVWTAAGVGGVKVINHFKIGEKVFGSLSAASAYVCQQSPVLQKTLGFLTDKLLAFETAYSRSTLGQGIEAFESSVAKAALNVQNGFKGLFSKSGVTSDAVRTEGIEALQSSSQTVREKLFGTNDVKEFSNQRVRAINERMPINSDYAGKTFHFDENWLSKRLEGVTDPVRIREVKSLSQRYPDGVPFTGTGHPDFSRYAVKKVEITFSGESKKDIRLANKLSGFSQTPDGKVWHHHHDSKTLMLIDRNLHDAVRHTGGDAIVRSVGK